MQLESNNNSSIQLNYLNNTQDKTEFNKNVKEFLEKHQTTLESFLIGRAWKGVNGDGGVFINEEQLHLRELFFTNPTIQGYLSRSSKVVVFDEYRPLLTKNIDNPEESDYYECQIYELAEQERNCEFLLYRKDVLTDRFYKEGTGDQTIFSNIEMNKLNYYRIIETGKDIYVVKDTIRRIEYAKYINEIKNEYSGVQFILTPVAKDTHATTLISIIQKETFKHLASIFINSSKSQEYFLYISDRFNLHSNTSMSLLKNEESAIFYNYLTSKFNTKTAFADFENKEGYIFDSKTPEAEKVYDAFYDDRSIKILHDCTSKRYILRGNRDVPLIDASHDLQLNEEDKNCSLYSFNFLQGIVKIIEDKDLSDTIYDLAEKIDAGVDQENATKEITAIFTENLKAHLPYYDSEGKPKSYAEIKQHHLHQRWDIGSLGMNVDKLRALGYLK